MSSLPVFVGLDYHQDSVQVCVLDSEGEILTNRSVVNDAGTIQGLSSRFGAPRRVAIEACCGSADLAEELSTQWQLPVQLAHPGYVKRMKQSPDKTDFSDAQLLAENRLKCRSASAWTKAWYAWLTNEAELSESDRWVLDDHLEELLSLSGRISAIEAKIRIHTKDDPIVERLMQEKGVGLITAVTFRAEVGRVSRFKSGKQLSRFCGVTPRNASSGARQADAGLIRAGNPALRAVLIELAHRLIRSPGKWSSRAEKMLQRGKAKNVVVAAIANRWVRWLYHELRRPGKEEQTSAPAQQKGAAPTVSAIAST